MDEVGNMYQRNRIKPEVLGRLTYSMVNNMTLGQISVGCGDGKADADGSCSWDRDFDPESVVILDRFSRS